MSYEYNPEWTTNIVYPDITMFKCPHCGVVSEYAKESLQKIYPGGGAYVARHIPKTVVFTCSNPNCSHCDEDYGYSLSVVIIANSNCNESAT